MIVISDANLPYARYRTEMQIGVAYPVAMIILTFDPPVEIYFY